MPMRIGLIAYPLFVIAIAASKGGVVSKFAKANAFSPETARKPASLSIRDTDSVCAAAKRGLLIATANGLYYVNQTRYRRRQRLTIAALAALGIIIALLTVYAFFSDF